VWGQVGRKGALEVFCGCGRLTKALRQEGIPCDGLDIVHGVDLFDVHVIQKIKALIRDKRIGFIWLGVPCTTFSIARRGLALVRTLEHVMGLPGLSEKAQAKVNYGNKLLYITGQIATLASEHGIPWVIENPKSSRIWATPVFKRLGRLARFGGQVAQKPCITELDFCQYGENWKKPTRLLAHGLDLSTVCRKCCAQSGRCSRTGHLHMPLSGWAPSGQFKTRLAQPYPVELCKRLAACVKSAISLP
jgi:hypothetical protein